MPKKRKTRKEKIYHDQKVQTVSNITPPVTSSPRNEAHPQATPTVTPATFSLPVVQEETSAAPEKTKETAQAVIVSANDYSYLATDLVRTALLTGAIVFAELLIRLFFVH